MRPLSLLVRTCAGRLGAVAALSILACSTSRPAGRSEPPAERSQPPAERPAGETTPAPRHAGTTVYACPDGVRFSIRPVGDSVVVSLPERMDTLPRVEAASGAKYAAGGVVFWSKGEEASLEAGGASHTGCRGRAAGDPWEEAALMGVEFRAVGQEPGWALDLAEGRWIRYVGDYGATRVYAASPRQARGAAEGTVVYDAEPEGRALRVEIRQAPCRDVMSGQSFTHAVTVRLDTSTVKGCGWMTRPGELTNTYWKLTELDGQPVVVGKAREPHLRLRMDDSRADGSAGCNSFSGTYERAGDRLTFGKLVTTMMACIDPALSRQEQRFLQVLASVDRAAAVGDRLTLYAKDRPVARFVAVYFQ
jgi:heat shock protein HslJ/membrane-bound inhibitor of C-type lysozyme